MPDELKLSRAGRRQMKRAFCKQKQEEKTFAQMPKGKRKPIIYVPNVSLKYMRERNQEWMDEQKRIADEEREKKIQDAKVN